MAKVSVGVFTLTPTKIIKKEPIRKLHIDFDVDIIKLYFFFNDYYRSSFRSFP